MVEPLVMVPPEASVAVFGVDPEASVAVFGVDPEASVAVFGVDPEASVAVLPEASRPSKIGIFTK
jgi:hypothetical protein